MDIDPIYWTIDETKIESAITEKTTWILATHVFGNPCNVEEIERIAKKHKLYVIYDAAHCFGVKYKGKSIFDWSDISTCSFQATKIFHTGEGGAPFFNNKEFYEKVFYSHNFGHKSPTDFHGVGNNGKISELQATMGLAVLPYMNEIIENRRFIYQKYYREIEEYQFLQIRTETDWNYHYVPMFTKTNQNMESLLQAMTVAQIFPRRYFYTALNTLQYVNRKHCVKGESISNRIVCLPISNNLEITELSKVIFLITVVR